MKDLQLTLRHIYESNLIEDIDDLEEDIQSLEAWAFLIQHKEIDHTIVCGVQRLITQNQLDLADHEKGEYRRHNIYVGGQIAPSWTLVKELMHNWLLDYKGMSPKKAHIRFEHIHPFADGNGRTGRMLMWWTERQRGIVPTLFLSKDRDNYYKWFEKRK
jgi:Fic family protein